MPSFSIKDHIVARQAQQHQMQKNVFQAASAAMDWLNDEDLLYGRIIGLKMKSMEQKKRKRVRISIWVAPSRGFPAVFWRNFPNFQRLFELFSEITIRPKSFSSSIQEKFLDRS